MPSNLIVAKILDSFGLHQIDQAKSYQMVLIEDPNFL